MQDVDARLLTAAQSVKYILGEDYHNQLSLGHSINQELYLAKSKQLSEFAKRLDLEYVYAMVLEDGQVYFTASSYTNQDIKEQKITYYLDHYPEATQTNVNAFYSTEPVYEYSEDQWGHFRTIFVPFESSDGRTYLTGADITIRDLQQKLTRSVSQAIITASFFFFIALLVGFMYVYLLKRSLKQDPATGYANHIALELQLIKNPQLHMQLAIILVSDLEEIIRFYGSPVGDRVMKVLLDHTSVTLDSDSQLFRLSNNKIAILSANCDVNALKPKLEALHKNAPILTEPFIYITVCAGFAVGNKQTLVENARIALEQAKCSREHVVFYSDSLSSIKNQYQHNLKIAKDVREAFEAKHVTPYFQPIVSADSSQVIMYESLARVHTDKALLYPEDFLCVVTRSRMGGQLTRMIFLACVKQFRNTDHSWSMNLTAQDMLDPVIAEFLDSELKRYPNPKKVTFELVETEAIASFNEIKNFIAMLKTHGAQVYIDDFGTGYSNISNLLKLNVDGLKLDASLVKQVIKDEDVFLFIQHIASFAQTVNLTLIAEGVENKLVLDKLTEAGIEWFQGFYFQEPSESLTLENQQAKAS